MVQQIPTPQQFKAYRANCRLTVHQIVACIKSGIIALTPWAADTLRRMRADHRESIARQRGLK